MQNDYLNEDIDKGSEDVYNDSFDETQDRENEDEEREEPQQLQRGQKITAIFLAIFGVFVIIIWMVQFKNNLVSPLDSNRKNNVNNTEQEAVCTGPECTGEDENLRFKDTDGDGLTDYDELNIYKTSPYLEDSDSDGLSDSAEINNEEDPNCPVGRDCYGSGLLSDEIEETEVENENLIPVDDSLLKAPVNTSSVQEQDLDKILQGSGDANTLRQALLEFGMDAETLNQISDEDLMSSYQETLSQ
jgi:hypothetical protein